MNEKRKRHLRVIDGGKAKSYHEKIKKEQDMGETDPKLIRLDQWHERMVVLFARQRT